MSVVVRSDVLRYELARRGLAAMDLARASGLSAATISSALAGHPISVKSLQLMAAVLMRVPVIEVIDGLVSSRATRSAGRTQLADGHYGRRVRSGSVRHRQM